MQLAEVLTARRAVRSYTSRPVDDTTIRGLLDAAVQAPSAMNAQPWTFAIVQNVQQLARWSSWSKSMLLEKAPHGPKTVRYLDMLQNPSFNIFYDAGTLIVIGCDDTGASAEADCWLAAENLMLAACDAGLGSCCIGFALPLLNTPEVKSELSLPAAGKAVAAIIVGYPRVTPALVPRDPPRIIAWIR